MPRTDPMCGNILLKKKKKNEAECALCCKLLKYSSGFTSTLSQHLKAVQAEPETSNEEPNTKRQKILREFVKNKSIEDVTKLASIDGLSFNRTANSSFIQKSFKKYNYDRALPSNPVSAGNMVLTYAANKERGFACLF